jgi:hypothetical protein
VDWDKHLPSILAWGGSVVTGVFTLLGVWLANRSSLRQLKEKLDHETTKEKRELQRAKLEELYSLVARWSGEIVIHHVTYRKVMEGELSYNQALDITINGSPVDAHRMFTLAELYFPGAHDALQRMKKLHEDAAAIQGSFKAAYKQGETTSDRHADLLTEVLKEFSAAVDEYQRRPSAYAATV